MGAPEDVIDLYEGFDHRGADLQDLLPAIRTDVNTWKAGPRPDRLLRGFRPPYPAAVRR
jgi:hypothetical protein